MLAEKLSISDSELPTRPLNARPLARFESAPTQRTHLMLVSAPNASPRGIAWARRGGAESLDSVRLQSMLRFERLNLG